MRGSNLTHVNEKATWLQHFCLSPIEAGPVTLHVALYKLTHYSPSEFIYVNDPNQIDGFHEFATKFYPEHCRFVVNIKPCRVAFEGKCSRNRNKFVVRNISRVWDCGAMELIMPFPAYYITTKLAFTWIPSLAMVRELITILLYHSVLEV